MFLSVEMPCLKHVLGVSCCFCCLHTCCCCLILLLLLLLDVAAAVAFQSIHVLIRDVLNLFGQTVAKLLSTLNVTQIHDFYVVTYHVCLSIFQDHKNLITPELQCLCPKLHFSFHLDNQQGLIHPNTLISLSLSFTYVMSFWVTFYAY